MQTRQLWPLPVFGDSFQFAAKNTKWLLEAPVAILKTTEASKVGCQPGVTQKEVPWHY